MDLNQKRLGRTTVFLFLLLAIQARAQLDCMLGVGGPDGETIIEVFQLNDQQKEHLANWSAELRYRNEILRDQAEFLLKRNDTMPPEELLKVSKRYNAILDSMQQNIRMMDMRMLALFNDRQYERYILLCRQLSMRPIHINRPIDER